MAISKVVGHTSFFLFSFLVPHVGLSEAPVAWLRRAHAVHAVALLQQEWSLTDHAPSRDS
jgi:hypothetical protein